MRIGSRRSRRLSNSAAESTLMRAAASSIASGGRRAVRQISTTAPSSVKSASPRSPARRRVRSPRARATGRPGTRTRPQGEPFAARHEQLQVAETLRTDPDPGRGRQQLLEVVEDEQQPSFHAVFGLLLGCPRVPARSSARPFRDGEHLQRYPDDAVGEVLDRVGRAEARAASCRAAGAGQRHEPVRAQKSTRLLELRLAPEQRRRGNGQVVLWRLLSGGNSPLPS